MVDDVCCEHDRIDHQTGDDKEARDEQGFAKEFQFDPCRIVLHRTVDRQSCRNAPTIPGRFMKSAIAPATAMTASISRKWASSSIPILLNAQAPARPSPIRISGTKTAISMSWMASASDEKPVVYIETQTANTTNESVSDSTVAPIVTTIGSSRMTPSL
jgi:hypothetical protein